MDTTVFIFSAACVSVIVVLSFIGAYFVLRPNNGRKQTDGAQALPAQPVPQPEQTGQMIAGEGQLQKRPTLLMYIGVTILVFGVLGLVMYLSSLTGSGNGATHITLSPVVTRSDFTRIETGMSYQQVVEIIGFDGEEIGRENKAGSTTIIYGWKNSDKSSLNATFQNGKLVSKTQDGLK